MKKIIECVPNFSEGRNMEIINKIVKTIKESKVTGEDGIERVNVLDVDPGEATNRTVVTFTGSPEAVMEAAFAGVKKAGELINMAEHHGAHPRSGATDVLPLIPVAGISLEECAALARQLGKRIYDELGIPCYCYEAAAYKPERKNLAVCRSGEYEALKDKIEDPDKKPDFGPEEYNETVKKCGATNVGARNFLIAVNFNLNTTSTRRANAIAFDVREKGRVAREGGKLTGKILKDEDGKTIWQKGTLKGCKAIGWYIDEYGIAQVSMNITDINAVPLHKAFEEVRRAADARGIMVTGTEIVGLVPKKVLLDAGKYFLKKQQRSLGLPEEEIVQMAIRSMGLDELKAFNPAEKVIEYMMENPAEKEKSERLIRMSIKDFSEETASESPAPGGGSISAAMAAFGSALATMVANLSAHKRGWDDRWEEFSKYAERGQQVMADLLKLIDKDTASFDRIMNALSLPKKTDEEKASRAKALEEATLYAAKVPLETMKVAFSVFELAEAMANKGNPASASDAGVAAMAASAGIRGAFLNVKINAAGLKDQIAGEKLIAEGRKIVTSALEKEKLITEIVNNKIEELK